MLTPLVLMKLPSLFKTKNKLNIHFIDIQDTARQFDVAQKH